MRPSVIESFGILQRTRREIRNVYTQAAMCIPLTAWMVKLKRDPIRHSVENELNAKLVQSWHQEHLLIS